MTENVTSKQKRNRGPRLALGDLVKIPVGLLFMCWSVVGIYKAFAGLSFELMRIVILVFALVVAAIFFPLGLVMAFGWRLGKPGRRTKASRQRPPDRG